MRTLEQLIDAAHRLSSNQPMRMNEAECELVIREMYRIKELTYTREDWHHFYRRSMMAVAQGTARILHYRIVLCPVALANNDKGLD